MSPGAKANSGMCTRLISWFAIVLIAGGCWAMAPPAAVAAGDAHGAAAEESGGGFNPLAWQTDLAIWTAAVFLFVLLVLWRFAWGPIADGLQKRENRIAEDLASAERSNLESRQLLADYQQKLANAEEEVRRMIDAARRDAERVGQQMIAQARTAAEAEHQRALADIETATAGAMKELAERSATLAVELAGKIVGSQLDARSHSRLIEQAVSGFASGNSGKH